MLPEETDVASFTIFVDKTEPRLKRALCATYGSEAGVEATRDALVYAWQHWHRIKDMDNPMGYLYTVGRSRTRRYLRRKVLFPAVPSDRMPWVEPGLPVAVARLSETQRVCVVLTEGYQWTHREVADFLGVSRSTVQTHIERALERLRRELGGEA